MTSDEMSLDHITKIVSLYPNDHIAWFDWGEPLLHGKIIDVAGIISTHKNSTISTNLSMVLTESKLKALNAFQTTIISLSGLDQETYQKYNVGGQCDLVLHNMQRLSVVQTNRVILRWQSHRDNMMQKKLAQVLAKELGFDFEQITLVHANVESIGRYSIYTTTRKSTAQSCKSLNDIVIDANGEYMLCHHTVGHKIGLHIDDEPSREMILAKMHGHPFCLNCREMRLWKEYF